MTKINFSLPKATTVTLKVYDLTGREIATIMNNEKMNAGTYSTIYYAQGKNTMTLASGVYFYRIITPEFVQTKKMVLVK